eukprot:Skav229846  [mRNA]  locus=scaffold2033:311620:311925:+ [translate_table: standard]
MLVQRKQTNPEDHRLYALSERCLLRGHPLLRPQTKRSDSAGEVVSPIMGHEDMDNESIWIHQLGKGRRLMRFCDAVLSVMLAGGAKTWSGHWTDDIGVHGV